MYDFCSGFLGLGIYCAIPSLEIRNANGKFPNPIFFPPSDDEPMTYINRDVSRALFAFLQNFASMVYEREYDTISEKPDLKYSMRREERGERKGQE